MNAKEKATSLYQTFYVITMEYTEEIQCSIQAKQCALICCEEIISQFKEELTPIVTGHYKIDYWHDVEKELNNL